MDNGGKVIVDLATDYGFRHPILHCWFELTYSYKIVKKLENEKAKNKTNI